MIDRHVVRQVVQGHELVAVADRGKRVTRANDAQPPARDDQPLQLCQGCGAVERSRSVAIIATPIEQIHGARLPPCSPPKPLVGMISGLATLGLDRVNLRPLPLMPPTNLFAASAITKPLARRNDATTPTTPTAPEGSLVPPGTQPSATETPASTNFQHSHGAPHRTQGGCSQRDAAARWR